MKKSTKTAKPYVLLFTLKGQEGVPPSLASAPCYLASSCYSQVTDKLHALKEAPVSKKDAERFVAALRQFIDDFDVDAELFPDVSSADDDWSTAYFSGISMAEAKAALESGGAIVEVYGWVPEEEEKERMLPCLERPSAGR